ncbi:MAG TPA: TVP38/TMEM64 family protein [Chthoniobacterales bacterium]
MNGYRLKFILFVLLLAGVLAAAKMIGLQNLQLWLEQFRQYVVELGPLGTLIFALVFAAGVLAAMPAAPFMIGAGMVFGFGWGLTTGLVGAMIGGAFGFLIGRYLARDAVAKTLGHHPKFQAIDTAIGNEGWKIVGLLRMCPFPFGLSNYLYGLTSVKFGQYLVATLFGILPSASFLVYFGSALRAAGEATLNPSIKGSTGMYVLLGVGVVAGVACLVYIGKIARAAVAKAAATQPVRNVSELSRIR